MTQPIQEPLTQRSISSLRWGDNQLYRRPAPQHPTGAPVEWIQWQSTTDWVGPGATNLSFTNLNGNYDSTTPTFDLSGTTPRICRSGSYEYRIIMRNMTSTGGVETLARIDLTRTAGATPTFIDYIPDKQLVYSVGPVTTELVTPWWQGLILYSGSAGSLFGTPTSLQVAATKIDDGTGVNDNNPYVTLTIVRLGDAYS